MKRILINAKQQEELRVALVDGQKLYDLNIENLGHGQKKSNIYKGIVSRIEPSLEAAFIEYGSEKHGFLSIREIAPEYFQNHKNIKGKINIKEVLKEGQEIIIQINKEERGNKGAALTTFISLAGNYLVLMPNNPKAGGISRQINAENRIELKETLSLLKIPENMGLIIRTAGLGKTIEILQQDLNDRLKHWETIKKLANKKNAPYLIHQESNIILRTFRDYLKPDISEILIDDNKFFKIACNYIQSIGRDDFKNKIKYYNEDIPLFTHYQIESQIESAFQRKVRLPSGGILVIDTTEALTAIDINSSKSTKGIGIKETAFNTNLEAVEEIARQLRLRDLGGLIVIDFIDMTPIHHQREIENRMREAVKKDRARIHITRISKFGLLEMSRQRLKPSLCESSHYICPRCNGRGTIRDHESLSLSILRLIEEEASKNKTYAVHVIVPIKIASYLFNEKRKLINEIEKRQNNVRIIIIPSNKIQSPHFNITRIRKGQSISTYNYYFIQHREPEIKNLIYEPLNDKKKIIQPIFHNVNNNLKKNNKKKINNIILNKNFIKLIQKKFLIFKKKFFILLKRINKNSYKKNNFQKKPNNYYKKKKYLKEKKRNIFKKTNKNLKNKKQLLNLEKKPKKIKNNKKKENIKKIFKTSITNISKLYNYFYTKKFLLKKNNKKTKKNILKINKKEKNKIKNQKKSNEKKNKKNKQKYQDKIINNYNYYPKIQQKKIKIHPTKKLIINNIFKKNYTKTTKKEKKNKKQYQTFKHSYSPITKIKFNQNLKYSLNIKVYKRTKKTIEKKKTITNTSTSKIYKLKN